jgi:hypothetical protein
VALDSILYEVRSDKAHPLKTYANQILHIAQRGYYLYICLRDGGIVQRDTRTKSEHHFLGTMSVAHLNFTGEHSFWAATLNHGLVKTNVFMNYAFKLPEDIKRGRLATPVFFDGYELRYVHNGSLQLFSFESERLKFGRSYRIDIPREPSQVGLVRWNA